MRNDANTTTCLVCGQRLVKNGRTAAGTQRWRCPDCGASSVRKRVDLVRRNQLREFLEWLHGKHSQHELGGASAARQLRRRTAWCWDIEPALGPVETRHRVILVDGIYIGSWCLLIAVTEDLQVLAWQWCSTESSAAWSALLTRIPAPEVVVCDGGTGFASAARSCWPEVKTQRCLFHVQMNIRRHLTRHPRSPAGRDLLKLSRALSRVIDVDTAVSWQLGLQAWWQQHGHLTKQRSTEGLWLSGLLRANLLDPRIHAVLTPLVYGLSRVDTTSFGPPQRGLGPRFGPRGKARHERQGSRRDSRHIGRNRGR